MISSLKQRPVARRPDPVRLSGRVLFLVDDPALVARQLAGADLPWLAGTRLRDNISTDEITPAYICYYYDERLGEFPYLGLKAGDEFPIGRGASDAGRARRGSSRRMPRCAPASSW
jgi:3-isopropylmalate/(R)-2-methylmalate dehydratase large subunit